MNNFWQRTLSGIVYTFVLVVCTHLHPISLGVLFLLISIAAISEFYTIAIKTGNAPNKTIGIFIAAITFTLCFFIAFYNLAYNYLLLLIPLIAALFIIELFQNKTNPFITIAFTIIGIIWITIPFSLLLFLVMIRGTFQPEIALGCFFMIWANDSGAYLAGSKFGKTKLYEKISPNKSWEGAFGGLLLTLITAYFVSNYYLALSLYEWMGIAMITVLAANIGDLIESLYKRNAKIKDSGTFLPGHGGVLDRMDSLLFVIPLVYVYLFFC